MLIINVVEMNGQVYLMNEIPEDRKKEVLETFAKYDSKYADLKSLSEQQLEDVKKKLTIQSAEAINYKQVKTA